MKPILLVVTLLLTISTNELYAQNDLDGDVSKLQLFLESVDKRYVDSVETDDLVAKAIRRMLEELDPHSVYMSPDGYKKATEPLKGEFVGIGIRYRMVDDTLTVVEVFDDSPAERGMLRIGDQFIAIDGDTVAGAFMNEREITDKIKGDPDTDLEIHISRPLEHEQVVATLQRDQVQMKSIEIAHMVTDDVGYVKLMRFSATSYSEFKKALSLLDEQGMENLILDLRGNSGGYLNVAIKIADEFLDDRKMIVYTEGLHQSKRELFATGGGRFLDGKLIVLMDENSASASEILAGAIQDWDRGLILGRRSYGKGLVQRTVEFKDGSAMRLTVSRYFTPTGRSIQKPYEEGREAYKKDIKQRLENGELYSKDSMQVNEDYVYFTPGNRAVYGGGGIIPDVFIPLDTTGDSDYLSTLVEEGMMEGYALNYALSNRKFLWTDYPTAREFAQAFDIDDGMIQDFIDYCESHEVELVEDEFEISEEKIESYLKSYIGRFTFDLNAFYLCMGSYDSYIQIALEEFDKNTFNELGLK